MGSCIDSHMSDLAALGDSEKARAQARGVATSDLSLLRQTVILHHGYTAHCPVTRSFFSKPCLSRSAVLPAYPLSQPLSLSASAKRVSYQQALQSSGQEAKVNLEKKKKKSEKAQTQPPGRRGLGRGGAWGRARLSPVDSESIADLSGSEPS